MPERIVPSQSSSQSPSRMERLEALEAACRQLRQNGLASVLKDSDHRNAALCERAWQEVAEHIDQRRGEA